MKLWWSVILVLGVTLAMMTIAARADSDLWDEDDDAKEVLVRTVRGTKERASGAAQCRYEKNQWSECDPKTNMRSRTLTLKKGDKSCEQRKVIEKKCKKGSAACRYEKGTMSGCVNMSMTRVDTLKANSDPSCEATRSVTKKCKPETVSTKKVAKAERANRKSGKQ